MSSQQLQFLNLRNLPARLTVEEAAWLLGFAPHTISVLVAAGLLKPLGQPVSNSAKYFATSILCELRQDVKWLYRATKVIRQHCQERNRKNGDQLTP